MKNASYLMIALGILACVVGFLTFTDLKTVNAVDSHPWTININGVRSFPWLEFTGGLLIALGGIFHIATWQQKKYGVHLNIN